MATVRTLIRRAMERTKAIGVADYISDDEANNALYELNLLVDNCNVLDRTMSNYRYIRTITPLTASADITIAGPDVDPLLTPVLTLPRLPDFFESVMYRDVGDSDWDTLDASTAQTEAFGEIDEATGTPERWYLTSAVSPDQLATLTIVPPPSQIYEYRIVATGQSDKLALDDEFPYTSAYEEYFLYQLASNLSPSLGTDATALQARANQVMNRIKKTVLRNVPPKDSDGDYSLMRNDNSKSGWGF